jgi:tetratricopeptide (TPR) repeat protein
LTETTAQTSQNKDMRSLPLLLLLPFAACATPEDQHVKAGDRFYRMGQFHDAYLAYSAAENPTDQTRVLQEESRFQSILLSAQDFIHRNEVDKALGLLDFIEVERPGYSKISELRTYAHRRRAAHLSETAESQLDDGDAGAAAAIYREALRWDSKNPDALRGFEAAQLLHTDRMKRGEKLYFEGLEENSEGHTARARTAFSHASNLLGEGSSARERLLAFSSGEAILQLEQGVKHLEAKRIGAAWVALMDAVRLDPENEKASQLLDEVATDLHSLRLLNEAEVHVLGGRPDQADKLLDKVLALGVGEPNRLDDLRQQAKYRRLLTDYRIARALELDSQIVRALGIYEAILEVSSYGFEDVPLRTENLHARVEEAASFYKQAIEAQESGEANAYREWLSKTVELAGDYEDALERLRAMPVNQ